MTGSRLQSGKAPHPIISLLMTCSQQAGGVNQQTIAAWTVRKIITVSVNSVMNYENTTGQGRGKEGGIKESGMLKNLIKKKTNFFLCPRDALSSLSLLPNSH